MRHSMAQQDLLLGSLYVQVVSGHSYPIHQTYHIHCSPSNYMHRHEAFHSRHLPTKWLGAIPFHSVSTNQIMYTSPGPLSTVRCRLVPDITPAEVDLLLGDAVSHRFLGLLAAGVEPAVLPADIELVRGDEAHEDDVGAEYWGRGLARGVARDSEGGG